MADQGKWFKLWCTAPSDDDLQALLPALRWAWAAFGAHTKRHGTRGRIIVSADNRVLAAEMGVPLQRLFATIRRLPHMRLEEGKPVNGRITVTWDNWLKYQEDSTVAERVKTLRSKRRREEKREEESLPPPNPPPMATEANGSNPEGLSTPRKIGSDADRLLARAEELRRQKGYR